MIAPAIQDELPPFQFSLDPPWEPPRPLDGPPVPPFPVHALPAWLGDFVSAVAVATQTPPDLAGVLGLAVLSAASARSIVVNPWGDWREPVNLFAIVVLPPGHRTGPTFADLVQPIRDYEHDLDPRRALDGAPAEPTRPADLINRMMIRNARRPRLVVEDCTPDRLTLFLQQNGARIAILSPTGGIVDSIVRRHGNGTPGLELFVKGHAGDPILVDRKGDHADLIADPAITIGVAAPPDLLRALVSRPLFRARGLPDRFLYALPASLIGRRVADPPAVPPELRARYHQRVRALLDASRQADKPIPLTLTPPAVARLQQFAADLEPRLAPHGDLAPIVDWATHLPALVARLAGLLHLAQNPLSPTNPLSLWERGLVGERSPDEDATTGHSQAEFPERIPSDPSVELAHVGAPPISLSTIQAACALGDYALEHARAAFATAGDDPLADARFLLRAIRALGRPELGHQRIWQATKSHFRYADLLNAALAQLVEHGYLRAHPGPERTNVDGTLVRGRKPAPTFELNPLCPPLPGAARD